MISKLYDRIKATDAPIVVGLDPKPSFIPERILEKAREKGGTPGEIMAESYFLFNREIIDNICDLVPAVKPQAAMYEQLGLPGMEAFVRTIDYAHEKGLLVIGDIKRGDIGSTSESYAIGHLGHTDTENGSISGFGEDFATVNPYLGSDGVKPFIDVCNREDKGIFVLVKTSNPSSGELQDRLVKDGDKERPLYEIVGEMVNDWGALSMDGEESNVGAVVGATYPEQGRILRQMLPKACILVPGYGAQGAGAKDLEHFFRKDGLGAIVNSSRGIIAAWKKGGEYEKYSGGLVGDAARAAVIEMRDDINSVRAR